ERLQACCDAAGAGLTYVTADPTEAGMLMQARRDVLPSLEELGIWVTDDVCVPRTAMAQLIRACADIAADTRITIAVVGHAGDGNMHPTMVYSEADPDSVHRARDAYDRVLDAARALGGTITGEHG